jgi:hypothetical protein
MEELQQENDMKIIEDKITTRSRRMQNIARAKSTRRGGKASGFFLLFMNS